MAALKVLLPPPESTSSSLFDHSKELGFEEGFSSSSSSSSSFSKAPAFKPNPVPPYGYGKCSGFTAGEPEDFTNGGAFPEIRGAQYPLGMGHKDQKPGSEILPFTVDAQGKVTFDAAVMQSGNASKIIYSQHKDLVPKVVFEEEQQSEEELQREIEESTQRTKEALEKIVNVKLSAAQPNNVPTQSSESKFIKYKPSQQSAAFNVGAQERIVRMAEMPVDSLEPPKFKHKRVPKASDSPPVPVMQSPPRPVTVKDQLDWKIPTCISNWKNPKGYTIPLDKRLATDGQGLQEARINDNFAKLSEALYVAEQKAREAVEMRSKVQRELMLKEKNRKEKQLRALAQKARSERAGTAPAPAPISAEPPEARRETREEREQRMERDKLRDVRRRERERERRLEARDAAMGKKSKLARDRDRDVSEKVALGMANTGAALGMSNTGAGRTGEVMYDQRLFNQEKGMESGFAADDRYNIYDEGLFTAQPTLSTLCRPKKDADADMYGGADEKLEKVMKTERFKPDKGFTVASDRPTGSKRERPVEFDKQEENDPFGLEQFLTEVRRGKKARGKIS